MADFINDLTEIIYTQISNRISERKKKLKLTNDQISENNAQLISNIMHNKRIQRKNPYLLSQGITYDIVHNLKFDSSYELIWGDGDQLDQMLKKCIHLGLKFLASSDKEKDLVKNCCYEFLPYAQDMADVAFLNGNVVTSVKGYNYEPFYLKNKNMAFDYVESKVFYDFKIIHKNYFENKGTKKLNKNLILLFNNELTNLLEKFLKKRNFKGLEAYQLMCSVIHYDALVNAEEFPPGYKGEMPISKYKTPDKLSVIHSELSNAGQDYIYEMVKLQIQTDPFFKDKDEIKPRPI